MIGDEILSGRTQDTNTNHIARFLGALGIDLREARVVPDVEDEIVAALNALRARYDFVFTTGGIGPTHDDITADAVAKAFGVGIGYHPEAYALLEARYPPGEFNEMRKRMARIPAWRRAGGQQRVRRAGLSYRQCLCDGRRADGDARHAGSDRAGTAARPDGAQRSPSRPPSPKAGWRPGLAESRRRTAMSPSAPIPFMREGAGLMARSWWCAAATRRRWKRRRRRVEAHAAATGCCTAAHKCG